MRATMLAVGLALVLAGCATTGAQQILPVAPTAVEIPAKPRLAIEDLPADAGMSAIAKAYAASLEACIGYSQALRALVPGQQQAPQPAAQN